jgi:hypothetical protein
VVGCHVMRLSSMHNPCIAADVPGCVLLGSPLAPLHSR